MRLEGITTIICKILTALLVQTLTVRAPKHFNHFENWTISMWVNVWHFQTGGCASKLIMTWSLYTESCLEFVMQQNVTILIVRSTMLRSPLCQPLNSFNHVTFLWMLIVCMLLCVMLNRRKRTRSYCPICTNLHDWTEKNGGQNTGNILRRSWVNCFQLCEDGLSHEYL